MSFSTQAWSEIEAIRAAIDELPLLRRLEDGTLPREVFLEYLTQDAHYLDSYGRTLAWAAALADCSDDVAFWARGAYGTVVVEQALHESYPIDLTTTPPSPTCTAYTSYLRSVASLAGYPTLVAAVLPCYWIYADVGARLLGRLGDLTGHPYAPWIATYADPEFAESCCRAREIADRVAAAASPSTESAMLAAFSTASRYEWMFWDASMRLERWPV